MLEQRQRGDERRPVTERLLAAVLFIKAVGSACVAVPEVNGFWTDQGLLPAPACTSDVRSPFAAAV